MRRSSTFSFDPVGLLRALWLLFSRLAVLATVTAAMCAAAYTGYLHNPTFTQLFRSFSTDHLVVFEQLRRAREDPLPDVAFFGDSSCLMGIDVTSLRQGAPGRAIESYCAIGYIGPVGYADMLNTLRARGARPKKLVIVLHPVQFVRHPSWDTWLPVVRGEKMTGGADLGFPLAALDYVRFEWVAQLLYRPLPGAFALFFGSATQLTGHLRSNHGGTIDPGAGLQYPSMAAFQRQSFAPMPVAQSYSYSTNEMFDSTLPPLAAAISSLAPQQTYLLISPIPQSRYGANSGAERAASAAKIGRALGIPETNIIRSPGSLPNKYFSSETHLNRWGRTLFTESLAAQIDGR